MQVASPANTVAIIGAGPAGVMAAYQLCQANIPVLLLDKQPPLQTLLATGGGRCNLTYAEFNPQELSKYYPRGSKFLLSVWSKFAPQDTLNLFRHLGIETYIQADHRVFPISNQASEVRNKLLAAISTAQYLNAEVQAIAYQTNTGFSLHTNQGDYSATQVVLATGGNRLKPKFSGYQFAQTLGHQLTELRPSLSSLQLNPPLTTLAGISLRTVSAKVYHQQQLHTQQTGDLLFTHRGLSGPLAYKISAYSAYLNPPLQLEINLLNRQQELLVDKLHQQTKQKTLNTVAEILPKRLAMLFVPSNWDNANLSKIQQQQLIHQLTHWQLQIGKLDPRGEIVTAGGVKLTEICQQTMQSKLNANLYFAGEIIDADGLTGGFNLQMCWSTGYIAGTAIANTFPNKYKE